MSQAKFTNPANGDTYTWPVNPPYDGFGPAQKQREIERTSNTGNVGATKQQGDDGPYIIHWEPLIYDAFHEQALWEWYVTCKTQTIWLTDFADQVYEGQIITLSRQEIGAMRGPGDTDARGFYCKYVFEFEVYTFLGGLLADAGVTA